MPINRLLYLLYMLVATCFHFLTVRCLFRVKKGWRSNAVLIVVSQLLTQMIIYFGDLYNLPPTLAAYVAGIFFACEGSRAKKLTLSVMLSGTVFALNALLDELVWAYFEYPAVRFLRMLFAVLFYVIIRNWGPDSETELGDSKWHLMLLLTLTPIGIVLCLVLLPGNYGVGMSEHALMYCALLLLAMFSLVGLLWAIRVLARQAKLERQSLYAQMNRSYYETMRQQHFEIRRLKHDLSNHLQTLAALPDGEKEGYLSELLNSPAFVRKIDYCGDPTVNAVLSVKEEKMREAGIASDLKIDIPAELPFEKADICAVFANALDNAIEGCMAVEEKKRFVHVAARHQSGMLVLSVKNPSQLILKKGEIPASTKPDDGLHGYGLESIREIVGRYRGKVQLTTENGIFELFLYLPEETGR